MKKIFSVKGLCLGGVIGALYAALTILLEAISFGPLQVRLSECMTVLPILFPAAIPGLTVGCFFANLLCSTWQDWAFGTLATLLSAILTYRLRKRRYLAALMPVLCNAVLVGGTLYWMYAGSLPLHMLSVAGGESIACYALGLPLLRVLEKKARLLH